MARVYSTNFIDIGTTSPSGIYTFDVGVGQTMVVREMTFSTYGYHYDGLAFAVQVLVIPSLAVIWQISSGQLEPLRTYMWEGREVIEEGGTLLAQTEWDNSSLRVNGYLLAA